MSVVLTDSRHSRGIDPKPGLSGAGYVELALGSHTGQSDTSMGLCAGFVQAALHERRFVVVVVVVVVVCCVVVLASSYVARFADVVVGRCSDQLTKCKARSRSAHTQI